MNCDTNAMHQHLTKITSRFPELDSDALLEIRCLKENTPPAYKKFKCNQITEAVEYACSKNDVKYNVYTTINPISSTLSGTATRDSDIIGSFYCFADADSETSLKTINNYSQFKFNFCVYTGEKPYKRGHLYYELEDPIQNMTEWSNFQKDFSAALDTDPVVCNPSRIMRLAGSINYPDTKKKIKGRSPELTTIRIRNSVKPIKNAFLKTTFQKKELPINFDGLTNDTYTKKESLNIQFLLNEIKSDSNWHSNMIKIVASYIGSGRSDKEIHQLLNGITLPGYSESNTFKEVQSAIDGARGKGFGIAKSNNPPRLALPSPSNIFTKWQIVNPLHLDKRRFLYGNHYISNYCSLTVSPGGLGKSTLVLSETLALVTGRNLIGVAPNEKINCLYYNAEDPYDEIQRRTLAICQEFDIEQSELGGLHIASGRDQDLLLCFGAEGILNEESFTFFEKYCIEHKIGLLILDPLANMHSSPETNETFRAITKRLSKMADFCNMAIEIVHHTRKIQQGSTEVNVEDSRGGVALIGAVRSARALNRMTKAEGESLGINHIDYFKIEAAGKNNLTRSLDKSLWYQRIGIELPNQDWVAIIRKFNIPSIFDNITTWQCQKLYDSIKNTELYLRKSAQAKKNDYSISIHEFISEELDLNFNSKQTKMICRKILEAWLESEILLESEKPFKDIDPSSYKKNNVPTIVAGKIRPATEL